MFPSVTACPIYIDPIVSKVHIGATYILNTYIQQVLNYPFYRFFLMQLKTLCPLRKACCASYIWWGERTGMWRNAESYNSIVKQEEKCSMDRRRRKLLYPREGLSFWIITWIPVWLWLVGFTLNMGVLQWVWGLPWAWVRHRHGVHHGCCVHHGSWVPYFVLTCFQLTQWLPKKRKNKCTLTDRCLRRR